MKYNNKKSKYINIYRINRKKSNNRKCEKIIRNKSRYAIKRFFKFIFKRLR